MIRNFPEFSKLTLADKWAYELLIAHYPPLYDLSFAGLMTWWNAEGNIAVARLNDNLVIPYGMAGGLSLAGTNKVDESICTIFEHLKEQGAPPRLVNVPDFVIASVQYPDMFTFDEERDYDEYILSVSQFYPLKNMIEHKRRKVERLLEQAGEEKVVVESLDLRLSANRRRLLAALEEWQQEGINDYGEHERGAIRASLMNADALALENICLTINGVLYGFCLYQAPADKRYAIIRHIKATHKAALGFELISYTFAKWFAEHGIMYVNITADFGIPHLRQFMLTMGPTHFFKKYTVTPASSHAN